MMRWYYKFLARRPFLMVLGIGVFSLACITVSFTTRKLPDFSDATAGFETRGTEISQRLTAWRNLLEETKPGGKLVADLNDLFQEQEYVSGQHHNRRHKKKKGKKASKKKFREKIKDLKDFAKNDTLYEERIKNMDLNETTDGSAFEFGRHTYGIDEDDNREMIESSNTKWMSLRNSNPPAQEIANTGGSNGFFCGEPMKDYSHVVLQRSKSKLNETESQTSLFDVDTLLAMCNLELELQKTELYDEFCEKNLNKCCRPWSLPNYIALLSNKSTCLDIDHDDVTSIKNLLLSCHVYYINMKLSNECEKYRCFAPIECTRHDAVYNIFHYLADMNFIKVNDSKINLRNVMLFLPVARSQSVYPLYIEMEKRPLRNEHVEIVAIDMGLKNALFDEYLKIDFWLLLLGAVFVMFCIWIYTSSLFITLMTLILIIFSLGIAYFIYTLVFEISFFPFMNVLAAVVIVGIGADEAFIFIKIWRCTSEEKIRNSGGPTLSSPSTSFSDSTNKETLNSLIATTLKHAAISMFVSSLTTAAAFYASYMTLITAIKCFGIFAGTTVIANYLLMVTWTPASVSIMERIPFTLENCMSAKISQKLHKSISQLGKLAEDFLINAVVKLPVLWILLLGSLGILSAVVVLYWPSIQLPDTPDFQLFESNHPFELYDMKFRDKFWFEKSITSVDNYNLPLRFVWGILPIDNGNYLDPFSRGDLYFDNNFNMSSIESQMWLLEFCKRIKDQQFYQYSFGGILMPNCFIENFVSWMNRKCFDPMEEVDRSPCCETSKFPYEPNVFDKCLILSLTALYATPREFFTPGVAGPKFERPDLKPNTTLTPQMKALIVEFESSVPFTLKYSDVKSFVNDVEKWFNKEIQTAPAGLQNGWFTSELTFFDLQDTLSKGTAFSILISMSVSLVVLLFVTLNVLVSLYAVITMTFSIFMTIAILILLGWKLNILESISISTAIGLVVDYSLHYSVHYRLSTSGSRESATIFAMSRMIGPTAMAALTTGAAGAFMMFSNILPYVQIGMFLLIVISVSWIYATLFLMSLLKVFGPEYGFMQFSYPKLTKQRKKKLNGTDFRERKANAVVSEQLLTPSSSAVGDLINSETHELDSLNSSSTNKPTQNLPEVPQVSDYERVFNRLSSLSKEYRSPSTGSAVTVVLVDDHDAKI